MNIKQGVILKLTFLLIFWACAINSNPLEKSYEQSDNEDSTVMVNIDGQRMPVTLPVHDVPPKIPKSINTHRQRDQRIDEQSVITLPDHPITTNPISNPQTQQNPLLTPSSDVPRPPSEMAQTNIPNPPQPSSPNNTLPSSNIPSINTSNSNAHPNETLLRPPNSVLTPHPPNTEVHPPFPPSSSHPAGKPATHNPPQKSTNTQKVPISVATVTLSNDWLPLFSAPSLTSFFPINDFFGSIQPIYTETPEVVQYVNSPIQYFVEVVRIVYSVIPQDSLKTITDLSLAITNILRENAENLTSATTSVSGNSDSSFRTKMGEPVIPTPNDITSQVQNAVQTYAQVESEDIQNELTKELTEDMARLLKPLYQNIAYSKQLSENNTSSVYKRNVERRSPQNTTAALQPPLAPPSPPLAPPPPPPPVVAASETVAAISSAVTTTGAPNTSIAAIPPLPNPTLPISDPNHQKDVNVTTTMTPLLTSTTPHPSGLDPNVTHPNTPAINNNPPVAGSSNSTAPPPTPALAAPNYQNPNNTQLYSKPSLPMPSNNPEAMAEDILNALTSIPNQAMQSISNVFTIFPNPLKIVYNFMNTIATTYPKIQLSALVGLATFVTSIVAKVLEVIATIFGVFASMGRRRRDLSLDPIVPPSDPTANVSRILDDLHKDIKDAVENYIPEAPKHIKSNLTTQLYMDSLDVVNTTMASYEFSKDKEQPNVQNYYSSDTPSSITKKYGDVEVQTNNKPLPQFNDNTASDNTLTRNLNNNDDLAGLILNFANQGLKSISDPDKNDNSDLPTYFNNYYPEPKQENRIFL